MSASNSARVEPESMPDKYTRQWTLSLVESLYEATESYCRAYNTPIESLTLSDFAQIAESIGRTPLQCMIKIRTILMSGTIKPGVWSRAEDELLQVLVQDGLPWKKISKHINSVLHGSLNVRNSKHCSERWSNHLNPLIKKGPWSLEEDHLLLQSYSLHGKKWDTIAAIFGNRTGTAVKNRFNCLLRKEKKALRDTSQTIVRMINELASGCFSDSCRQSFDGSHQV